MEKKLQQISKNQKQTQKPYIAEQDDDSTISNLSLEQSKQKQSMKNVDKNKSSSQENNSIYKIQGNSQYFSPEIKKRYNHYFVSQSEDFLKINGLKCNDSGYKNQKQTQNQQQRKELVNYKQQNAKSFQSPNLTQRNLLDIQNMEGQQ
ncbi:hypothetical protein PPERSA_11172 [Pseudocohnilembus persalinus]|uniref:Uncharacterized protein n=1 Tax=Pseudocohnilembus persalinus TaxID=266149 RepID=A0A0V0QZ88_PSEPJ|nr:hypothetical protein PPERSA_11172 [Pseudocohnilembus persalinus]|eukprot:KRX07623.1 hypothetical protein PPERSA_11172 [Pseudocohnilembus persalinus]